MWGLEFNFTFNLTCQVGPHGLATLFEGEELAGKRNISYQKNDYLIIIENSALYRYMN